MAVKMTQADLDAIAAAGAKYNAATDKAGRDAAHAEAEAIRAKYNYSGGTDGSQYIALGNTSTTSKNNTASSNKNSQYTAIEGGGISAPVSATATYGKNPTMQNYENIVGMTAADQAAITKWGEVYNNATTKAQRDYAHQMAESIRAKYNYSGGTDGSEFVPMLTEQIGSFNYDTAPVYRDQYSDRIDAMLNQILNREAFSYDAESDPLYQQYREQYTREGQRAMEDTLGQVAARTGGMASSYATTAAQQSNQYYMQQLADKIPELYQLAYQMYLDDIDLQVQDLGLLQGVSDTAYNRYRDTMSDWRADRDFAYDVYRDDIGDQQWQTQFDYNKSRDEIADQRYDTEWQHQLDREAIEDERYDTEWEYGLERDKIADQRYDTEWAHQVQQDALAASQWEKQFNHNVSQDAIANSQWEKQFNANNSQWQAEFDYAKQQDALAAAARAASSGGSSGKSGSSSKSGSSGSGLNNTGSGTTGKNTLTEQQQENVSLARAALNLGLAAPSAELIAKLITYNGVKEKSDGTLVWANGWNPTNYLKKMSEAKMYNPFGSALSYLK